MDSNTKPVSTGLKKKTGFNWIEKKKLVFTGYDDEH